MKKARFTVSVRRLVEFILRRGDLASGRGRLFTANRAAEGTRGHQQVQRSRGADYESEVPVKHRIEGANLELEIKGRIDGLFRRDGTVMIEEIKTTHTSTVDEPEALHLAQAKAYGAIFALQNSLKEIEIQVSYFHLNTGEITPFRKLFSAEELKIFFENVCSDYFAWVEDLHHWRQTRDASIKAAEFPFATYRKGQREFAVAVYRTLLNGRILFAQAPTGIGKTISVLFPALKCLPAGNAEHLFYLTAKTIGRGVVEDALAHLAKAGVQLRSLTLTARDKICFAPTGGTCDVATCPFALGYYDRSKAAIAELCQFQVLTRERIESIARKHQVCPFALSLDTAEWVDLIVCDFNYAFDPGAMLREFFGKEGTSNFLLIDEAHNLPERAREMFSAELSSFQFENAIDALGTGHACKTSLRKCRKTFENLAEVLEFQEDVCTSGTPPEKVVIPLRAFLEKAEEELATDTPGAPSDALREIYFETLRFARVFEGFDASFQTIYRREGSGMRVKLFCVDPAPSLRPVLESSRGTVFFSATLAPLDYYRTLLANPLPSEALELGSPFPSENLSVWVEDRIATNYKARAQTYHAVAASILQQVRTRGGNYLIFFPSYQYLADVLAVVRSDAPELAVIEQSAGMSESERTQFLARFDSENGTTVAGFAVMGGIFGEGIDLVGERLGGVVIVGVGLPQISIERDLIANYFAALGRNGFNYGYVFPGMNRVLQAVGRVIRSETDRGVALLIDERFSRWPYRELLPKWWNVKMVSRLNPF